MLMFALHNEPLLDERIFDWVKHIKSINPKCYCILPTNGELLDRFSLAEIIFFFNHLYLISIKTTCLSSNVLNPMTSKCMIF